MLRILQKFISLIKRTFINIYMQQSGERKTRISVRGFACTQKKKAKCFHFRSNADLLLDLSK